MFKNFAEKNYSGFYVVFRILVGLLFLQHGAQKLFGAFGGLGGNAVPLISLMGLAGIIEFFGGLFIVLGLLTRYVAAIAAIEMLVAYFMAHIPQGIIPILNQGEPALLFFASSLILISQGSKKFALDNLFKKK